MPFPICKIEEYEQYTRTTYEGYSHFSEWSMVYSEKSGHVTSLDTVTVTEDSPEHIKDAAVKLQLLLYQKSGEASEKPRLMESGLAYWRVGNKLLGSHPVRQVISLEETEDSYCKLKGKYDKLGVVEYGCILKEETIAHYIITCKIDLEGPTEDNHDDRPDDESPKEEYKPQKPRYKTPVDDRPALGILLDSIKYLFPKLLA